MGSGAESSREKLLRQVDEAIARLDRKRALRSADDPELEQELVERERERLENLSEP